ncbi:ABC transporter permease [Peribacillus sp. SCS-155]|uniref:ABC transporter permease n=1 Tax=Peribacillus sedimenti TaxID=3115297 RepID=UPI003905ED9B
MRILAIVKRISQQMRRDKRTLAMLFIAPLLILTLMYFLFNGKDVKPVLGIVNIDDRLIQMLQEQDITIKHIQKASHTNVIKHNLEGLLENKNGHYKLILQNSDPSASRGLQIKVNQAVAAHQQTRMLGNNTSTKTQNIIKTSYVYGSGDTEFFAVLSPILVGFFVFFFVFLISGIGLLKERTTGTLERLLATPIRRWEIVAGYLVGYGIFAVFQTAIIVLYAVNILDIVLAGSIWNVFLINLVLALAALSLGTLLSSFAASEFQMVQFIPLVVIPQVFFAGILPFNGMADWLQAVGKIMPLYYAGDALKAVMYKGLGLADIAGDMLALVIFAVLFICLNILALKKYRTL